MGCILMDYVHGYSTRENERLGDQADTLADLLHHDTAYPAGSRVLEAGCGTGAQTIHLARRSPAAQITAVDISAASLYQARQRLTAAGIRTVSWHRADLKALPFAAASFDHVFVCFVLEHLPDPVAVLAALRRVLKPGGTLTVIEGDHGTYLCHPCNPASDRAVQVLIDLQARAGGDALIGRRLYPLLTAAGFGRVATTPRPVYVDASRPSLVEGFTRNTFTAMVRGVRDEVLAAGMIEAVAFDAGLRGLERAAEPDGTFFYCFFKAIGIR